MYVALEEDLTSISGAVFGHKAETPGPLKDTKLTPRIKETAKTWHKYLNKSSLFKISIYDRKTHFNRKFKKNCY